MRLSTITAGRSAHISTTNGIKAIFRWRQHSPLAYSQMIGCFLISCSMNWSKWFIISGPDMRTTGAVKVWSANNESWLRVVPNWWWAFTCINKNGVCDSLTCFWSPAFTRFQSLTFTDSFTFIHSLIFTRGQFWPSGIVVPCVCVSVWLSVCVSITCLSAW